MSASNGESLPKLFYVCDHHICSASGLSLPVSLDSGGELTASVDPLGCQVASTDNLLVTPQSSCFHNRGYEHGSLRVYVPNCLMDKTTRGSQLSPLHVWIYSVSTGLSLDLS